MEAVYVVKGAVSDPETWAQAGHPEAVEGQPEYQFSDGPPGCRGSSADFLSLEEGFAWFRANRPGVVFDLTYAGDDE